MNVNAQTYRILVRIYLFFHVTTTVVGTRASLEGSIREGDQVCKHGYCQGVGSAHSSLRHECLAYESNARGRQACVGRRGDLALAQLVPVAEC